MVTNIRTRFGVKYRDVPSPQALTGGDGDTLDNDITLTSQRIPLVLYVNADEYTRLLSAAINGANIYWPERWIDVIWPLIKAGKMELCAEIANCIDSNAAVQTAVSNYLKDSGYGSGDGTPDSPTTYNANELLIDGSQVVSCDNDALFGAVTQLVDLMNDIITDAFEGFEAATEGVERYAAILEAIPITNVLAIDDIVQFADQLLENIAQSYAAEYTVQTRDDFRCDLFCLVKDTCELDFKVWADYFLGLLNQSITENAFSNAISWFLGGNFSNEEIVYAAHALLCNIFAYGSSFFGVDMVWFGNAVTAALNDPDTDWTIICSACNDLCYIWDFTIDDRGWTVWSTENRPFGQYSAGVGWQCTYDNVSGQGNDNRVYIENINWATTVQPTRIEVDIIPTNAGGNRNQSARMTIGTTNKSGSTLIPNYTPDGTPQTVGVDYALTGDGLRVLFTTDTPGSADADALTITAIRLFYTSGQPEGGAPCV